MLIIDVSEGMKFIGNGPSMNKARNDFSCGVFNSNKHNGRPVIVVAAFHSETSEFWDFTVLGSKWEMCSQGLPYQFLPYHNEKGARMSQTRDEKGLIMTYKKHVYSFHCDSATQCYWKKKTFELKINRVKHIMLTVPSTLVDKCKEF